MQRTYTEDTFIAPSDRYFLILNAIGPTDAVFFFTDTIPYVEKSPMLKSTLNCTVSKFL